MDKGVLLVSIAYPPNLGGVETHLEDLTKALVKRNWNVSVLTYKPLTAKVSAPMFEKFQGANVIRIPWASNIFYKLVNKPALEFLYLFPGLFISIFILLIFKGSNFKIIHAHGLVAGFVSVIWGKLFGKRVIVSTHSVYSFPEKGAYRSLAKFILQNAYLCSALSKQAAEEIVALEIDPKKVGVFTYWIDLDTFKRIPKAKQKLDWKDFNVLFIGRLVPEKGIRELIESSRTWDPKIFLNIAGTGPLAEEVKREADKNNHLNFLGPIDNNKLAMYYSAADILIVPSTHEEGFGRVILESLACETPVIGSNRGAIPEAMDESVGKLINVNPGNIKNAIEDLYKNPKKLKNLQARTRVFVMKRYSEKNVEEIISSYER
jgi:glycosyltransferase involved in cell wall biosynthesis